MDNWESHFKQLPNMKEDPVNTKKCLIPSLRKCSCIQTLKDQNTVSPWPLWAWHQDVVKHGERHHDQSHVCVCPYPCVAHTKPHRQREEKTARNSLPAILTCWRAQQGSRKLNTALKSAWTRWFTASSILTKASVWSAESNERRCGGASAFSALGPLVFVFLYVNEELLLLFS